MAIKGSNTVECKDNMLLNIFFNRSKNILRQNAEGTTGVWKVRCWKAVKYTIFEFMQYYDFPYRRFFLISKSV